MNIMLEFAHTSISPKSGSQIRVLGDGHVIWSKLKNEGPQMLGVTVQNLVAFLHMPRSYNTNFGRGVELWNNTVVNPLAPEFPFKF